MGVKGGGVRGWGLTDGEGDIGALMQHFIMKVNSSVIVEIYNCEQSSSSST